MIISKPSADQCKFDDQDKSLALNYLAGDVSESETRNHFGNVEIAIRTLLADGSFRGQAIDVACEAYRELVKRDEQRYWRYTLWNPNWETEYVDLLLRQGRSHPELANRLAQICHDINGKQILEVGCGFGKMACELTLKGADVTAVDIIEEYLRIARIVSTSYGLWPNRDIEFRRAAAEALPFPSDSFDVIWSDQTIEHVQNVSDSLKEMIRVLKPGGLIFVRCPNYFRLAMREPHFKTFWPPFMPRAVYRWILAYDYKHRAKKLPFTSNIKEQKQILEAALADLYKEMNYINFVKPWQVAFVLNNQRGFNWRFIRGSYRSAQSYWKKPLKWLWYQAQLDVLWGSNIFLVGSKHARVEERLGLSPVGLW